MLNIRRDISNYCICFHFKKLKGRANLTRSKEKEGKSVSLKAESNKLENMNSRETQWNQKLVH